MSERTKQFGLDTVLSVTTNTKLADSDRVYDLVRWMTGEPGLIDLQFPSAVWACRRELLQQFPDLIGVRVPPGLVHPVMVRSWLVTRVARHGGHKLVQFTNVDGYLTASRAAGRRLHSQLPGKYHKRRVETVQSLAGSYL